MNLLSENWPSLAMNGILSELEGRPTKTSTIALEKSLQPLFHLPGQGMEDFLPFVNRFETIYLLKHKKPFITGLKKFGLETDW